MGATLPAHQSPVSVPAPGKLLSVSCASLWALRSNLDKALPDWALGCDTLGARWELKGWGAAEKSQRAVSGTDAVGHSVINPKAWIPVTVLLLICWWLGQVVSPLWASFSLSVKWT